jgi:hypothetical protein
MEKDQQQIINRMKIGLIFKAIRTARGMSQVDASLKLGYANATFTCMVEKGGTNIPIDKVMDFASVYGAGEVHVVAAAIMKLIHQDAWKASGAVYKHYGNINIKKIDKDIDKWIKDRLAEYSITI